MRKYLAFDIEIAKSIPDGCTDWKEHRPLGISCAATWASDEPEPLLMYGTWEDEPGDKEHILPQMDSIDAVVVVENLMLAVHDGYTILTHNGTSFDFDILAEESGMFAECRELALNAVDTMFQFLCLKGFPVSLNALAKGMGLSGKTEGMNGAMAPQLWATGNYQQVLDYVAQDVRTTLDVALACEREGVLWWVTKAGAIQNVLPHKGKEWRWLTVKECLDLPLPDVAWMRNPMKRSDRVAWMQRETA
jgi:hypothetical protein